MEERHPGPLQPAVIARKVRQQQAGAQELRASRELQDEAQHAHDAADLLRRDGVLHRAALHEADVLAHADRDGDSHRHDAEAADLYQREDDELAE